MPRVERYFPNSKVSDWTSGAFGGAAGVTAPKATGGEIGYYVDSGTGYWVHTFYATEAFVPSEAITADVMIVAGGGAGGGYSSDSGAGGGGAGGLVYYSQTALAAASHTATIGAGATYSDLDANASPGSNSSLGSLTAAVGGGYGASAYSGVPSDGYRGGPGGSGGGALAIGGSASTGGTATANQGNAGGQMDASTYNGGGGGGAMAVGGSASAIEGGAGAVEGTSAVHDFEAGSGTVTMDINGTGFAYAGGGGGAWSSSYDNANIAGGVGGGGIGGSKRNSDNGVNKSGTPGAPNTGGGGGGCMSDPGTNGGSGIIIVRYEA